MSDKKRKAVTLDPENHEYLQQQDNASAVVNDLVAQLRQGGDRQTAAIELQIEQKERELEEAEGKVDRLTRELTELRQLRATCEREEDARLEQADAALEGAELEPTNPAVENWAGKLGMTPGELVDELTQ
jgi:chromosome segregation ATPase